MDFSFDPNNAPAVMKPFMYVVLALFAIKQIADVFGLRIVWKELKTNGGSSLKDKSNQSARDAKEALGEAREAKELSRWQITQGNRTEAKVDWLIKTLVGRVPPPEEIAKRMDEQHKKRASNETLPES